jgi:hypothetical protein
MIIDGCPTSVLVAISDPFEGISELDEYLFLICDLLAAADVDFLRRHVGWVWVVQLVRVILLQPIECLLVLDRHVALLYDDDEDVHDHAIKGLVRAKYLHNGDEDIDIDVEVTKEEAGRDHVLVDRDQVVAIHHSEEREEGVGK